MAEQHIEEKCPANIHQDVSVCVPVEVIPVAEAGSTKISCCDDPIVTPGTCCCPGNRKCHFTITQKICIKVPIELGVNTEVGDPYIVCGKPTTKEICTDCISPFECGCTDCNSIDKDNNLNNKENKPSFPDNRPRINF